MPRYRIKLKGFDAFFIKSEHLAYEGGAIIFYDVSPYQPNYVLTGWEAQIREENHRNDT